MGNIVNFPVPLDDAKRHDLIEDLARFSEGILTEKWIRTKWKLSEVAWTKLGDDKIVELVVAERLRRTRNGESAREKAQVHFEAAPDVYAGILKDPNASPRHRLEAGKELRVVAANGPEAAAAADRFVIQINLGSDVEVYNKSRAVDPNDQVPTITTKDDAQ